MIKKWEIIPSPTDKNKTRHKLLLKCEMKDIFFIVKKLGSICSRPEKMTGDYNFLIYLSKLEMDTMTKLKQVIKNLSEIKEEDEKLEGNKEINISNEPVFDLNQIKEKETSSHSIKPPEMKVNVAPEPKSELVISPPPFSPETVIGRKEPDIISPKIEIKLDSTSNVVSTPEKTPKPPEKEIQLPNLESKIKGDEKIEKFSIPSAVPPKMAKPVGMHPSSTGRIKKEEIKNETKTDNKEKAKTQENFRGKLKWPIELPLNPTLTFQTLLAGPHNRFAHAASMAVVENPGVMYNPLLIFGPQGIGKSHFMFSIAYGLANNIGQQNIFITDAIKFSIGLDIAIKQGWIDSIEKVLKNVKAIIIDDINLFMVSETNKPYISRILNECINSGKQIVVSSLFPPKTLAPLENSLNFQFTQGWMVDIKTPNSQTYRMILDQMLTNMDIKLSDDEIKNIFISNMMDFRSVSKILNAVRKIEKYLLPIYNTLTHSNLIQILAGMNGDDNTIPSDNELSNAQSFSFPKEKQWFRWGFFYPKGLEREVKYVAMKIKEFAKELNINLIWNQVFIEEYNSDEILGIPFKIGNFSKEQNINGLIILGPHPTSVLGSKEVEFRHLTEKILESFAVKTAWIPSTKLKAKSVYLMALMELI